MSTLSRQQGFTLIEVLAVMLVLVAIATVTIEATSQLAFDGRYQVTQDRYDKIKTAILGNPNQTINGHPSVSGFVADMGRLPTCLRELSDGYNCSATSSPYFDTGSCSDGSNSSQANCLLPATWNPTPYQPDPTTKLGYGWRGGYIETTSDPATLSALPDGWGNNTQCFDTVSKTAQNHSDIASCQNAGYTWILGNYGWGFFADTTSLTIKSYGKDGIDDSHYLPPVNGGCAVGVLNSSNTCSADIYDNDYPQNILPIVASSDWQSTQTTLTVNVVPNSTITLSTTRPTTEPICTNYGGTWNATGTPTCTVPSEYTQTECANPIGTWNTTYCSSIKSSICLDMYYHNGGNLIRLPSSTQLSGTSPQSVQFTLTAKLPMGQAAFRITDCSTPATYPVANRDFKIVDILPNRSLNFDW